LPALFADWRTFQQPKRVNGVPDYSASAMAAQHRDLAGYVNRLAAIDPSAWPISQQVDYHVVRAEMNGLDFDHRVLQPWANNPAFYVTVFLDESDQPAREGPLAAGGVDVWKYAFPLSTKDASEIAAGLAIVPGLLEQAKTNLVGHQKDLWTYGTAAIKDQSAALTELAARVKGSEGDLKGAIDRAKAATDAFASWLDSQASSRTEPSGVGVDNYNWYLKNVQLVPYTWQDEFTLMERELTRSSAALVFEERRHATLPPQAPIASAGEHDKRFNAAVTEYMAFLKDHDLMTIRPDMDPGLRARIGTFSPGPREFFGEVDARAVGRAVVLGGEVVAQRREPFVEPGLVVRVDRAVDGPAELLAAVVLQYERAVDPRFERQRADDVVRRADERVAAEHLVAVVLPVGRPRGAHAVPAEAAAEELAYQLDAAAALLVAVDLVAAVQAERVERADPGDAHPLVGHAAEHGMQRVVDRDPAHVAPVQPRIPSTRWRGR